MNKIIRQIKSSILLQLTGIACLIIIVLVTAMAILQNYIGAMERENAETLCESLLKQSSDALGLYQENIRYQASLFCRLPLESFLKEEKSGGQEASRKDLSENAGEEILSEMQKNYERILLKNGEITSIAVYDGHLRKAAVFGRDFDLAPDQKYMRTKDDFSAVKADGRENDYYYCYYYPIYEGLSYDEPPCRNVCVPYGALGPGRHLPEYCQQVFGGCRTERQIYPGDVTDQFGQYRKGGYLRCLQEQRGFHYTGGQLGQRHQNRDRCFHHREPDHGGRQQERHMETVFPGGRPFGHPDLLFLQPHGQAPPRDQILIALVLGGMPISGGAKVRFENIIVGALLYTVLNNGLTMMGMTTQAMQLIQGVVFLIFVAVFADRQSLQVIK